MKLDLITLFLSSVVLGWAPPSTREGGAFLYPEEIAHYTLYEDQLVLVHTSGTEYTVDRKGCHTYYVTTTDTQDIESKPSNQIEVCNRRKGKKNNR